MVTALLPILCLVLVAVILKVMLDSGLAARIAVDTPNERSLHVAPVPRIGGVVVIAVALTAASLAGPAWHPLLLIAAGLALVSAWDDRHGLSVLLRLMVHLAAATGALLVLKPGVSTWLAVVGVLALTWAMNLYNFMDGADGLAGGMAAIGFSTLGVGAVGASPGLALTSFCIAAAACGFLLFNFHPARVFLGDAGSVPLGFLAGSLGLAGWSEGLWPLWFPLLVFSPFLVDASLTLAARLLRGEKPWRAHREHAYQRMVAGGLGHRRTALLWYALMAACAASALLALRLSTNVQWTVVAGWVIVYGVLAAVTARRFPLQAKQ